ncbi:MAG TPA: hypothetical protein VM778_01765, partial [Gemmatimonadota bacterium]|nr:hypothetical protein [Gemmatimonadota bacterium]
DSKQLITAAYTGTEDEILKKVEVGDIRVALPPSRFMGANAAVGTFGAQAVAQLGPVDLRVLGSRKEGQSTSRSITISPGGGGVLQEVTLDIKDTQFQNSRFFFIVHPDSLAGPRLAYPNKGSALTDPASRPVASTIDVWLDDGNFTNNREQASKPGVARVNPLEPAAFPSEAHTGFFDLLIEGEDYVITDALVLQMRRQLNDDEVLAVAYTTVGETRVGTVLGAQEVDLKLIKPLNPDTLDFTWDYTLRNVYSLREPDIELSSLALSIYRGTQDLQQTFEVLNGETRKYSEIFGVTDENGRVAVPRVLRDPFGGPDYLVFPDVLPFFQPTDATGQPIPLEVPNRRLYFNSDPQRTALDDQVYFIGASYLSRGGLTGEVELGAANVLEGSETITIGNQTLVRGQDYQIFYDFGQLVFTDPAGLAERHPNQSVSIRFEVAPLFNLAPTSLWGAAGTWRVAQNAALNTTLLVQDQESLANRPILGAEPTRTMIGEVDGSWASEMPVLTRWLDALPGIETEERSHLSVRGELAYSLPDPNTEGRVFLNDFENIEIAKQVSLFFRIWRFSSAPQGTSFDLLSAAAARWYTFALDARQVTPGIIGVDQGENVLFVELNPRGDTPGERRDSWRSIAVVLSPNGEDLTRQEFVEFFVRGERGTILVDLGTVDEDAVRFDKDGVPVGVGVLDTEEANPDTRDNNLDVGEDTGLDGVAGRDILNVPGDDGNDDMDLTFDALGFPVNPNGTENNTILDSEDHNLNGLLDRRDDVLRWELDLTDSRYVVPGSRASTGFRKIRLPLSAPDELVGDPDRRNVRIVRLTFSDVEERTEFRLARLEIVGSTFLERGIVGPDGEPLAGPDSDSLRVTAVNGLENPNYTSPPGVSAVQDRADQVAGIASLIREQSLELGYDGVPPGARGAIYRPLFDRETYIDYERMAVWVQGRPTDSGEQPRFFVAFGIDTLNVYEYAAPLQGLEWEEHVIDFDVFTRLKESLLDSLDQAGAQLGTAVSEDGLYRVRITSATTPPPTLTEVGQLTIGVENTTGSVLSGAFWINEWRLQGPVREGGAAAYLNATAELADVASVTMFYETRGARYRSFGGARNNFDRGTLSVDALVRLDRFLPEEWGVSVPLTWTHGSHSAIPLFRAGSDILLTEGSELKKAHTRSDVSDVVTVRAFRSRESRNPLIAATLDRLETRITWRGEESGSVDLDTDRGRLDAWLGYRHGFRSRTMPLGLGWIADLPWPEAIRRSGAMQRLASADLNLAPTDVSLSVETVDQDRRLEKVLPQGTDLTADTTRTLAGTARLSFQPLASMRASFRLDNTRDLIFPETVISRGALGVDAVRSHDFDFSWTPPVAKWITPRYTYSSSFRRNHTRQAARALDSLDLRDFSVITNETLTMEFSAPELVATIAGTETVDVWWRTTFEPVRMDFRRRQSVAYVQEEDDPGLAFSLGFGELERAIGEERPQNVGESESMGITSGLALWRGARLTGGYRSTDEDRRYFEGSNEISTTVWPEVELRWPNLRVPLLSRWMPSLTLRSDYERQTRERRANGELLQDDERDVWNPLAGVTIAWVNGITTDLRANSSSTRTATLRGGEIDSRREESSTDLLLNLNWHVRPGTRLYIPFPTLWGVTLQKPLLTGLTVARRWREDATLLPGLGATEQGALNLKTLTTEIRPSVSYEFGRVVSGFAFSYLAREDLKRDIVNKTMGLEAYLDFLF